MKEIKTLWVSGNDYKSIWECENCGHTYVGWGYADCNFDDNVIPNAICPKCGKSAQGETAEEQMQRLGRVYKIGRYLYHFAEHKGE